jgi:hypothetical protein
VRDEEGALGGTVVRVDGGPVIENVVVDFEVIDVDRTVERDQDHLWNLWNSQSQSLSVCSPGDFC